MSETKNTNTGEKQGRKKPMPPESGRFKKGDPRINRKGRPRKSDVFRKILEDKFDSVMLNQKGKTTINPETGKPITYGEYMVHRMFLNEKNYKDVLDRMLGKVKEETEHSGEVTLKVVYGDDHDSPA